MEAADTGASRAVVLRAALERVPTDELVSALSGATAVSGTSKLAGNALNALRRHRDPASVLGRPQYRAALPVLASTVAEECLTRTVEILGDHSEEPTKEQLLEALAEVRASFPDTTVAVMLASVAEEDLPSSELCAEILAEDESYGLTAVRDEDPEAAGATERGEDPEAAGATERGEDPGASPEQRAARRERRGRASAERRRQTETARLANERVRRLRKQGRP